MGGGHRRAGLILVTGSSGQLGAEICRQLDGAGLEHSGLDARPGQYTKHVGDVRDRGAIERAVRGATAIIHTASLHAPHVGVSSRRDFVDVNIAGTLTLLDEAARAGVRRFIYTSSTSVYGHALVAVDRAVWVTEELQPRPRDIYDLTKLAAEELCRDFSRQERLTVTCLRTCRYFPEDARTLAIHRMYRGADVRDVAAAHLLALSRDDGSFELLNVAAPYRFERTDLEALLGRAPEVIERRYPSALRLFGAHGWALPQSIDRVYVSERAVRVLGYRPQHGFEELGARARDEGP